MPRLIRSSRIAIIATLITASSSIATSAAETDNRAQAKAATPAPGGACSLITKEAGTTTNIRNCTRSREQRFSLSSCEGVVTPLRRSKA
jgi:hypothetical protein